MTNGDLDIDQKEPNAMKCIDELILERRAREREYQRTREHPYRAYALSQIAEKGYFTAGGKGDERFEGSFVVTLHPLPRDDDALMFHDHNFFELAYVYRGHCRNLRQGYEVTLSRGDLLLMNPRAIHCMCTDNDDDVVFNFLIPPQTLDQSFLSTLTHNPIADFFLDYLHQTRTGDDFLIVNADDDALDSLLAQLILEFDGKKPGYQAVLQAGMAQAIVYMARRCSQSMQALPLQSSSKLARNVLLYIAGHAGAVSLKDAAQSFSYSEKYISRLLKKELGLSFTQLAQHQRLQTAAQLLHSTTMPVKDIAERVGYHNLSHFYTLFQADYGLTPAAYRLERGTQTAE